MSPRRRGWEPVRVKKMRSDKELEHDVFRLKHIMLFSYYYRMLFCEKPDSTFSQHALEHPIPFDQIGKCSVLQKAHGAEARMASPADDQVVVNRQAQRFGMLDDLACHLDIRA